jgi:hypothetical protein
VADADGTVCLVVVQNALSPHHVRRVQSLARCVRQYIPKLYESRAMYQEMNLDEDPGLGGNCPTHLAPLVSIFLPDVVTEMYRTLQFAFQAAGWAALVEQDSNDEELTAAERMQPPDLVGMRASEHLTYKDFPSLDEHDDGSTLYTMNFAFSGADDYQGGEFYIITDPGDDDQVADAEEDEEDDARKFSYFKPNKYDAIVFLGGRFLHGVAEITGGHREMFSTEFWPYPDVPFGSTLWTNTPGNMEDYIEACNEQQEANNDYDGPCTVPFSKTTGAGLEMDQVRHMYSHHNPRYNRVHPEPLDCNDDVHDDDRKECDLDSYRSVEEEPDLLVPKELQPGEMVPLRWRDTWAPIDGLDDCESFVIGFPPEFLQEFQQYIQRSGMMELARKILYEEEPLKESEHRLYTLEDGHKWGAMVQGSWKTDLVWLDPADEECFESLLTVLRKGNFDMVLDKIGRAFDLNGLMIQGVGALFLSEYKKSKNMHIDMPGAKGSFYNVIVPIHIPENETAKLYVADHDESVGLINLKPDVGIVLGGESYHGTGECNYRKNKDFRLSFAIYIADINEDNVELIALDSTSLWPTEGDRDWFWAQQGRVWSRDGLRSLKNDKGRKSFEVEDERNDCPQLKTLCESDLQGVRLECPKTCKLYLEDDVYYSKLLHRDASPAHLDSEPVCVAATE